MRRRRRLWLTLFFLPLLLCAALLFVVPVLRAAHRNPSAVRLRTGWNQARNGWERGVAQANIYRAAAQGVWTELKTFRQLQARSKDNPMAAEEMQKSARRMLELLSRAAAGMDL